MAAFLTVDEGFEWIEKLTNFEKRPPTVIREYRLDRMKILFELFSNPHLGVPSVHIAGSKGKGSCAYMIAGILKEAGITAGLYTSPHILHYRERFLVDMEPADDVILLDAINEIYDSVSDAVLPVHGAPTTFEILTLLAFLVFQRMGCKINVIETGLGGRLDATNLVDPVLSVITSIELEHTNILGNTLKQIAAEKGGIIKKGKRVISSSQEPEAYETLVHIAAEKHADLTFITSCYTAAADGRFVLETDGERFSFRQPERLPGRAQNENAAVSALAGIRLLKDIFPERKLDEIIGVIGSALAAASIPGRFERYTAGDTDVIIDGAHTKSSLSQIMEVVKNAYDGSRSCLFGMVDGKDISSGVSLVLNTFGCVCVTKPGTFKKSDTELLFSCMMEYADHNKIRIFKEIDAVRGFDLLLKERPSLICVTGSFYLAGIIKKLCIERGYEHAD